MPLINRTNEAVLRTFAAKYPVLTITGPRQSGKTTLCKKVFAPKPYANLKSPDIRQFAIDDPRGLKSSNESWATQAIRWEGEHHHITLWGGLTSCISDIKKWGTLKEIKGWNFALHFFVIIIS